MSNFVYEMVTDRIIAQLEGGVIPWEKPWFGVIGGAFNRVSKKNYSLLNQMLLKHDGEYATFKQWQSFGGKVRQNEKSEIVVFWKVHHIKEEKDDGVAEKRSIPVLRYYSVFHISQVEGVKPLPKNLLKPSKPIDEAEKILHDYLTREKIVLTHKASNMAYYSLANDCIIMPLMEQFREQSEYYSTIFHEVIHSTMKENRCNRTEGKKESAIFGSEVYSKEELIAEIGSANILNVLNIETKKSFRNSVAYIQGWLSRLRNDVKFIVSASSKAEKATKYVLGDVLKDVENKSWVSEGALTVERPRERYSSCEEHHYSPSCTAGDYSPSHPWDAPGMSIRDFV